MTNHLSIDCLNLNQQLTAHLDVIEHLQAVPGMVPNMIQESAVIEGVQVKATMDCATAASVCDRETAYKIFQSGKAVFCQGSQKLLSLHAFGSINITLYDRYFAARVKACDTCFNQIFFIVNSKLHPVLLSLPALIAAQSRLLTVKGHDMMPETHSALMLDLTKMDQHWEHAAKGLNSLAYQIIEQGLTQSSETTWENLNFEDFSL